MKIHAGVTYTNDISDLAVTITKVYYESKDYFKVKATIFNKRNKIIYETKNFKLEHV